MHLTEILTIMKKNIIGLILATLFLMGNTHNIFGGTIIVNLEGISTTKGGKVYTAVFDQKNFLKFGEHIFGNIKPVTANQAQVVFENVPAGSYGIATFQDVDGNEDLSKNLLGIPKEPMGFSRNPRIMFGPPNFKEAEIIIQSNETVQITIKLK